MGPEEMKGKADLGTIWSQNIKEPEEISPSVSSGMLMILLFYSLN